MVAQEAHDLGKVGFRTLGLGLDQLGDVVAAGVDGLPDYFLHVGQLQVQIAVYLVFHGVHQTSSHLVQLLVNLVLIL